MPTTKKSTKGKKKQTPAAEKRQYRWRSTRSSAVQERIRRAKREKMVLLKQKRVSKYECKFVLSGSTGNLYDVTIGKVVSCTCPDYLKRQDPCKHTLHVLLKHVGLDIDDDLLHQKAFLKSELKEMFQGLESDDDEQGDDIDDLIHQFGKIETEEGGYKYDNVRKYTGQSSVRDNSTYRPYHWERRGGVDNVVHSFTSFNHGFLV